VKLVVAAKYRRESFECGPTPHLLREYDMGGGVDKMNERGFKYLLVKITANKQDY